MSLKMLRSFIADVKGNIGDAEIYGRPHSIDDRYLEELQKEYRDTHAKYLDLRALVVDKIGQLAGTHNAITMYEVAKSTNRDPDEQIIILEEYLQSICPHDKTRFYTTGSVHLILGEAWDDIEEHAQCEFCGKEVNLHGTDLQDESYTEF